MLFVQKYYTQPIKQIPITYECDVLVAGGFAGISAALSAARQGAKVLLCEKQYVLGGLTDDRMLATVATTPQVRMTHKISGEYTLDYTEQHKEFFDSIGMVSDWRKAGPVFEIPFRTLYSKTVKNLITAGRSISVTDDMWDVTRVIPDCAVTGEAAGLAAAISNDFSQLDIKKLQTLLTQRGVKLHENQI